MRSRLAHDLRLTGHNYQRNAHWIRTIRSQHHLAVPTTLPSWDLNSFKENAFSSAKPCILPLTADTIPAACSKWFIHNSDASYSLDLGPPRSSELRTAFWADHEQTIVPLELTSKSADGLCDSFARSEAPLKILLDHLGSSALGQRHSIYLAQCSLFSLPETLRKDIPTPSLVVKAGKGDVYESSLWLGRPPTYTPLHKDPNPNLFLQLAGRKTVRLFPPQVGNAIFEHVQEKLRSASASSSTGASSPAFRGEEMMAGPERELLHSAVWEDGLDELLELIQQYGQEAEVGLGQALFIPKSWWHSIKGIGEGITASVNWWFR